MTHLLNKQKRPSPKKGNDRFQRIEIDDDFDSENEEEEVVELPSICPISVQIHNQKKIESSSESFQVIYSQHMTQLKKELIENHSELYHALVKQWTEPNLSDILAKDKKKAQLKKLKEQKLKNIDYLLKQRKETSVPFVVKSAG